MSVEPGNWDHLPQNPLAFFALAENFERRDLKRAYGVLIRKYKPETHPKEFQKIRAAYEQLENANRYGRTQQATQVANAAWDVSPSPANKEFDPRAAGHHRSEAAGPTQAAPLSLVDTAITQPRETFKRLRDKDRRSPQEYYVLAVLSDLLNKKANPPGFLGWLLTGLKEHPSDPGLLALVAQYLHTDVTLDSAPKVLQAVATTVRSPVFYRLTETLWERVLREQGFETFQRLLGPCERLIRQTDPRSRWAFYLRILRTAIWKAPPEWTESRLDELEAEAVQMDPAMEQDLEFLALLRNHLKTTKPQLAALPTRARLDHLLHEYCTGDGPAITASLLQGFSEIARDAHGMRRAFPVSTEASDRDLFLLTLIVSADLAETAGIVPAAVSEDKNNQQAVSAFRDVLSTVGKVGNRIQGIDFRYKWIAFLLFFFLWMFATVLLVILPLAFSTASAAAMPLTLFASAIVCVCLFVFYLFPKHLSPRLQRKQQECLLDAYETQWRERLFRYVQSCGEPASHSLQRLHMTASNQEESNWLNVVLRYCEADLGLLIFARAQTFLV